MRQGSGSTSIVSACSRTDWRSEDVSYRYVTPDQTLIIGAEILSALPAELKSRGIRKLCVIASPRASGSAAAALARQALAEFEVVREITEVRQHAPIEDTERWSSELRTDPPDAMVAIGGGSPSDTAKAIAILLAEGGR